MLQQLRYTVVILSSLILLEVLFVALATGYLAMQLKSPLLENLGFFIELAREDLLSTLKFLFVDNPLFIIQSQHKATGTIVWSLHYYALTVFIHLGLAIILAVMGTRYGSGFRYGVLPLTGSVLIVLSSLYLFLGSCCSGGPNWIVQTWLLAVVFNPVTSTNSTILLYQSLKGWFVVLQLISGATGVFLLLKHYRRQTDI